MLLPTDIYAAAGVGAVILTVLATILLPERMVRAVFPDIRPPEATEPSRLQVATGLLASTFLGLLLIEGMFGPRDPLRNLLPLTLFTGWWVCFPLLQALFGDLWRWINPWSGVLQLLRRGRAILPMPRWLGFWPAIASLALVAAFALTDIAPEDPPRLARVVAGYWAIHLVAGLIFGAEWLRRGEGVSVFLSLIACLSPRTDRPLGLRAPGWKLTLEEPVPATLAVFAVTALALGSFDGLNETFWWLGWLGINPLEYPGRSAVVWPNRGGMLLAVLTLNLVFFVCVLAGWWLAGGRGAPARLWARLALTLLPIALGYHVAHFLTQALVNLQYLALAPIDRLGGTGFFVTTSFFNQTHTVKAIWLTQAGAIVLAHVWSVLLAHRVALSWFGSHRGAVVSQLPVATFMVLYTLFGLWLLSTPVAL